MKDEIGLPDLDSLSSADLMGKTIFIRCDFNVPVEVTRNNYYRVADDTRIRRFLDLTFKKIHELTDGNCRLIIGSHLGRPHKDKDHSRWDGIFNMQFVCTHFDTLIRKLYGDLYTIFPPEIIDSHLKNSLDICSNQRMPLGGIKFLPNLRYLLDPENPDAYRKEFIEELARIADVFINCAFGCSHRLTKSIKMLPQIMRQQGKLALAGVLLCEEIKYLNLFGKRILANPKKAILIAGGSKIADKIGILKQFVLSQIKLIFIGGKMANAFLLAQMLKDKIESLKIQDIPSSLLENSEEKNKALLEEIRLADEIIALAAERNVSILFPEDYKIVREYKDPGFSIKTMPDFANELQLDLGPRTISGFSKNLLDGVENIFWNGPLGAYDHPSCSSYGEGSMELAKLLFAAALENDRISVVIGGGDSAAILNKFNITEMKVLLRKQIEKLLPATINKSLLAIDFNDTDTYILFNYFASNFFVSTGGGAALEFLEGYLKDKGQSIASSYLPGTNTLMELSSDVEFKSERVSKVSAV
ncbi:MAG: phosphoglycerate kinase [Nitrospinae bacterium RIFCSPLOWO2_12_FULL_47_7]|nr:MAG: phosphoglycerate kinase [Nitrospinae bacterium RIFCSPLOWO2_12_FULL_47_7]